MARQNSPGPYVRKNVPNGPAVQPLFIYFRLAGCGELTSPAAPAAAVAATAARVGRKQASREMAPCLAAWNLAIVPLPSQL